LGVIWQAEKRHALIQTKRNAYFVVDMLVEFGYKIEFLRDTKNNFMKILILGGGNMGLTYAQSFLRSRIVTSDQMMVLCKTYEKANQLSATHEGRFFSDPRLCVPEADLYNKSDLSCENWIAKVASKGGTTEAALGVFNAGNLHNGIIAGAQAAQKRAVELGK
jgi:pyrroline-5-carboxylate reductase